MWSLKEMANGAKRTVLQEEGEGAYERIQTLLRAADIDPKSVESITVDIRFGGDVETHDVPAGLLGEEPEEQPVVGVGVDEDVEYGPTETEEGQTRRGHNGGGGEYGGSYPPHLFKGEAIRPDSQQGKVLDLLDDREGEWLDRHEVSEEFEDIGPKRASTALSHLMNQEGWVKRRERPTPNVRGKQREYTITESGRSAIAEGKRRAEKYHEEQREEMEEAEAA